MSQSLQVCEPSKLSEFAALGLLPEFVKQADTQALSYGELKTPLFADTARRMYPCHNKVATTVSYLCWLRDQADQLANTDQGALITENFAKFANYFGIMRDLSQLQSRWQSLLKAAEDNQPLPVEPQPEDYLMRASDEFSDMDAYPVRSQDECQKAATWLTRYWARFPFPQRQKMAERLLDKAEKLNVSLPHAEAESLRKQAGYGLPRRDELRRSLAKRARALRHTRHASLIPSLQKLANQHLDTLQPREGLLKLAAVLDACDTLTQMRELQPDLERPEEVCFGLNQQATIDFLKSAVTLTTGELYAPAAMASITRDDIYEIFPESLRAGLTEGLLLDRQKLATTVSQLPRPYASALAERLQNRGVSPVYRLEPEIELLEPGDLAV